jgi:uncharacterized membrane protein
LKRESLKIFTDISFYIAVAGMVGLLISILTPLGAFSIVLVLTMLGIPLSIVSMFSREQMAKRIIALAGNFLPISLFIYALLMDFMDEFFRAAP